MTVLGKILAFLNLAFALTVGGFIVVDFATRTNWHDAYMKLRDEMKVAEANWRTVPETTGKLQTDNKTLLQQRDAARAEIIELQTIKKTQDENHKLALDEAQRRETELQTTLQSSLAEKERYSKENQGLISVLAQRDKRIVELVADVNKFRSAAVSEESARKATQDRLDQQLTRVAELEKEIVKINSKGEGGDVVAIRNRPNPPTVYVEGKIDAIHPEQSNLVNLNVGSDKGLSKNHTLEVYRISPPTYLGMIRIVDVTPHTAVGRLERAGTANRTPLRVGDTVASTLTRN